jgi:hypothetical protein
VGKVKFELSVEKITFKFEGDQDTCQAMNHTLGSLMEAQNRVIDVTPREPQRLFLPTVTGPPGRAARHRRRLMPDGTSFDEAAAANSEVASARAPRVRRARSDSFRGQVYGLIQEGYFAEPRTATEIREELVRLGHRFDPKNVASDLLWLVKKKYLSRDENEDKVYAYVKGTNNDFPGGQNGS